MRKSKLWLGMAAAIGCIYAVACGTAGGPAALDQGTSATAAEAMAEVSHAAANVEASAATTASATLVGAQKFVARAINPPKHRRSLNGISGKKPRANAADYECCCPCDPCWTDPCDPCSGNEGGGGGCYGCDDCCCSCACSGPWASCLIDHPDDTPEGTAPAPSVDADCTNTSRVDTFLFPFNLGSQPQSCFSMQETAACEVAPPGNECTATTTCSTFSAVVESAHAAGEAGATVVTMTSPYQGTAQFDIQNGVQSQQNGSQTCAGTTCSYDSYVAPSSTGQTYYQVPFDCSTGWFLQPMTASGC